METIKIYDTVLRDGMQTEGISFSLEDKLAIAKCLDKLGVDYVEGGYAGSNPKDSQFFAEVAKLKFKHSRIVAFGSTHRANTKPSDDASLNAILACKTSAATLVGKMWDLHVTDVLGCSLNRNITICTESVQYLKKRGLEVIFDAEHFFDGYKNNPEYAMKVLIAVAVLCPMKSTKLQKPYVMNLRRLLSAFTHTMTLIVALRIPLPLSWLGPDTFKEH